MTIIEQLAAVVEAAQRSFDTCQPVDDWVNGDHRWEQLAMLDVRDALAALPPDWEQQLRAVEREAVLEGERRIDAAEARVQSLEGALGKVTDEATLLLSLIRLHPGDVRVTDGTPRVLATALDAARAALAPKAEA